MKLFVAVLLASVLTVIDVKLMMIAGSFLGCATFFWLMLDAAGRSGNRIANWLFSRPRGAS